MTLYLAIGGGGDVVMAAALAGDEAVGQIPWERYVVDPTPGPVPPDALRDVAKAGRASTSRPPGATWSGAAGGLRPRACASPRC
jgi:hypothetical protein